MIFMSLITCVASAIALVAVGGATKYGLYAGTGKFKNKTICEWLAAKVWKYFSITNDITNLDLSSAGFLGFFVSWQYGSCYSWVAQKGDISGRPASIFFIG